MSETKRSFPASWATAPLGQAIEAIYGKALPEKDRRSGGKFPVVGSSGLVGMHDKHLVATPSLVIGRKGNVGAVHLMNGPSWPIDTTYYVIPPAGIHIRYLAYLLRSIDLAGLDRSTAIPGLSRDDLYRIEISLAPATEQTRIVAKLEELLSDLDAGIAELAAARRKLDLYRQSLLKSAVEGELTAGWREQRRAERAQQGEPLETGEQLLARILAERRARWEASQLEKFLQEGRTPPVGWRAKYIEFSACLPTDLADLPDNWIWATIDQLSPNDLANGRSVPSASGGAKVLRLTAIKEGKVDLREHKNGAWSEEEAKPFAVALGDLLVVRGNGSLSLVGRAGLVSEVREPVAYPDTMIRLRLLKAFVRPAWVAMVWDSAVVRSHFERRARTSAGIYKISQTDIRSVAVPVPPLEEQDQILKWFEQASGDARVLQASLERNLQQGEAQKRNILKAAFSGQLVPQDSNDEPASVLLDRIRAERAMQQAGAGKRRRKTAKAA